MFKKVVQDFTDAAIKLGWPGSFQKGLPQQEPALPNAYESNDRNVAGLSYKKDTIKVQQLETFPTQYIGASKFLFGRIPAGGSSGIAKPSLGGDVQFKKLGDTARLNPALCYSESQPVSFGASQQTVKNILAEGKKSDILSGIWGLMQNPISYSFREGEMHANTSKQHIENSQEEQLQSKNKLKSQIKELNGRVTKLTEEKDQLDKGLNSAKQSLNEKDEELESKNKELEGKIQELGELKSANEGKIQQLESRVEELEALKSENEKLKGEIQQLEVLKNANEELKGEIQQLETLKSENEELKNKTQQLEELKSANEELKGEIQQLETLKNANEELNTKLQESENKNKELESKIQELEALKSANEKLKGENNNLKIKLQESESKNKELEDDKNSKPPAVNVQGVKSKVNYASASFMLSWVCAVGASLATPYLAMCATLAVAASVFLALGGYCLYKANTTLSNVEVDQQNNQQLLESSL